MAKNFLNELRKRHVPRFALLYVVISWLVIQVVTTLFEAGILPEFLPALTFYGLAGFFPVALILAWFFDFDLQKGISLTQEFQQAAGLGKDGATPTPAPPVRIAPRNSVAVLPFADLSPEKSYQYFSDGVAEEILNALVKVKGLRVAGRTSSFALKGQNLEFAKICEILNVAHVLEGSVRKQADRVRVTTQLTKAADGYQLWSESYDGSADDIFDFQDKISCSVAEELSAVITSTEGKRLVEKCTDSDDAYNHYLQGRTFFARRIGDNLPKAIESFRKATDLDPGFARAWAAMAQAQVLLPSYIPSTDSTVIYQEAKALAEKTLAIDPAQEGAHAVLGTILLQERQYLKMEEAYQKALAQDAQEMTTPQWYAQGLLAVGRLKKAERILSNVVALDPLAIMGVHFLSLVQWMRGNNEPAEQNANKALKFGYAGANFQLAEIVAARGDTDAAIRLAAAAMPGLANNLSKADHMILGRGIFGDGKERLMAMEIVSDYLRTSGRKQEIVMPYFLVRIGEVEKAIELFRSSTTTFDALFLYAVWAPYGTKTRQHPAFKELAQDIGLVDYWKEHGWPDCHRELPGGDFTFQ